jgi:glycerol-3-phosphate dehydrogenase (NAD(P)+)
LLVMQDKKNRILILGHGEMGHAMEFLLAPQHALQIWQRHPPSGAAPQHLEALVPESAFILFCLPATALAEISARIAPHLGKNTLCLTISKGLDNRGHLPFDTIAATVGADRVAVLYGPMISEEIRSGKPAFAECGVFQPDAYEKVAALYQATALRLKYSPDIAGLSWSAVLKNVYALAFGMADELGLGDNVRGLLSVAALHEMSNIVFMLGGTTSTPLQLAGLGDLITTATSAGSHHHHLGRQLARGIREGLTGEGLHTLDMLGTYPRFDPNGYPLFRLIDDCVRNPDQVRTRIAQWLHTPFRQT